MSESTQVEIGTYEDAEPDEPGAAVAHADEVSSVDALMMRAMERGEDAVDALERLIALRERVEDRAAEMAMAKAMAAFQEACPPIKRTANGHHGAFAPLDEIVRVVRPVLGKYGLTFAHDGEVTEDGKIRVTCTLRHVDGATRSATFEGPPDKSGGKNPIQEMASTRSYLRRYTLTDVLGLSTELDDDGEASDAETISGQQYADLEALLEEVGANRGKYVAYLRNKYGYFPSLAELPAKHYEDAVELAESKRGDA